MAFRSCGAHAPVAARHPWQAALLTRGGRPVGAQNAQTAYHLNRSGRVRSVAFRPRHTTTGSVQPSSARTTVKLLEPYRLTRGSRPDTPSGTLTVNPVGCCRTYRPPGTAEPEVRTLVNTV